MYYFIDRNSAVGLRETCTRLETNEVRNATEISDFLEERVGVTNRPEMRRKWWPVIGQEIHAVPPNI